MPKIAVISDIRPGRFSGCEFTATFAGMRKPQVFVVYPVRQGDTSIKIQSDTRIGLVELATGICRLSANQRGQHVATAPAASVIASSDLTAITALLDLQNGDGSVVLGIKDIR